MVYKCRYCIVLCRKGSCSLAGGALLGGGKRQCALQGMWMVKENITQYSMTTVKMKHGGPITVLGMQDCR